MSILYNKIRTKFNLLKFNKLLSEKKVTEIFDIIKKITGINPIKKERIDYGNLDEFLSVLCDFKSTLEYTPFISLVNSNEPSVYGETEFGILKVKLEEDKKFKYYLTKYTKYDFDDRFIEDQFFSYNLYKENENVNFQNCVEHIYEKIDGKVYVNIVVFHQKDSVNWSKDKLKNILRNSKFQRFIGEEDKDIKFQ
tara:strand:+ start:105 stop:689 length:585 start_codon:yes stop_codon:yes gene_type:complete